MFTEVSAMLNKLKQKMEQVAAEAEEKAASIVGGGWKLTVPPEISAQRYSICDSCEFLYKITNTCKKCGCFMKLKTTLAKASCPIDKWDTYTYPDDPK